MHTTKHVFDRVWDAVGDLFEVKAIVFIIAVCGFFGVVFKIIDRLVDPPASELFAILNLTLTLPLSAAAYFFGKEVGRRGALNGNGDTPKAPAP